MLPIDFPDLVNRHDVRMFELGGGFGFDQESPQHDRRSQVGIEHHFEGDDAVEADLPGFVNHAHSTTPNLLQQLVVAELHPSACLDGRTFTERLGRQTETELDQAFRAMPERRVFCDRLPAILASTHRFHHGFHCTHQRLITEKSSVVTNYRAAQAPPRAACRLRSSSSTASSESTVSAMRSRISCP